MALDQVRSLNAAANTDHPPAQVPLLDEVLDLLVPTTLGLNIELKNSVERYPSLIEAVARAIDTHHMADRIVISSFNHRCMAEVAERTHNRVERAILYADDIVDPWDYARRLTVRTWTLDTPDHLRAARILDVDAVITNDPATAQRVLAED